jgi:WD40 repeat protein
MRLTSNQRVTVAWLVVAACVLSTVGVARADFTFGEPSNLGPEVNSGVDDALPAISADGLECYFMSVRPGGQGGLDLWVTTRATADDPWSPAENIAAPINSASDEGAPTLSADGLSLYFSSDRGGGHGNFDLYVTTRPDRSSNWGGPVNLGAPVNTSADQWASSLSADGLELYFCDWHVYQPGGYGSGDIWVSTRASVSDVWGPPANLGSLVNSEYFEAGMDVSSDGLRLYFGCARPGGYGYQDIWVAARSSVSDAWGSPTNLGPPVNGVAHDATPRMASDGSGLYFGSTRQGGVGGWDLWQVPILPVVDFNGDGVVDAGDIDIMIDCWGTDEPLCDIGPMPWGDGVVDVEDLVVLVEHIVAARADAEDAGAVE